MPLVKLQGNFLLENFSLWCQTVGEVEGKVHQKKELSDANEEKFPLSRKVFRKFFVY